MERYGMSFKKAYRKFPVTLGIILQFSARENDGKGEDIPDWAFKAGAAAAYNWKKEARRTHRII